MSQLISHIHIYIWNTSYQMTQENVNINLFNAIYYERVQPFAYRCETVKQRERYWNGKNAFWSLKFVGKSLLIFNIVVTRANECLRHHSLSAAIKL